MLEDVRCRKGWMGAWCGKQQLATVGVVQQQGAVVGEAHAHAAAPAASGSTAGFGAPCWQPLITAAATLRPSQEQQL
eukprot:scaffold231924_cov12-Tisochrysis_lutea.AAC.1